MVFGGCHNAVLPQDRCHGVQVAESSRNRQKRRKVRHDVDNPGTMIDASDAPASVFGKPIANNFARHFCQSARYPNVSMTDSMAAVLCNPFPRSDAAASNPSSTGPPDLANLRENYVSTGIDETTLPSQPHILMQKWVEDACNCKEVCMCTT